MPREVRIYKLALTAPFEFSDANPPETYRSTTWGGVNAPLPSYPEFAELENVKMVPGGGPSGQNIIDAVDQLNYTVSWVTLAGVGNQVNGQFDCRGGGPGKPLKVRWQQFMKSSAIQEADFSQALMLANGGGDGSSAGLFGANRFIDLEMSGNGGNDFDWFLGYLKAQSGGTAIDYLAGPTHQSCDDQWHEFIVTITPSTINDISGWDGFGGLPTASVDADGAIEFTIDGTSIISASGLQFVINRFAQTLPNAYFGKTIWHGD